ncbi:glutamine synthetase III [Desulfurivibrio alkaliphilus]|uniref:Glutamine synthetase catalytic region n=1 Tax=Desulfurivibrio alkaliphilus (strain DSM 19089 / UNIQEM U267 / AHT2) TaxID=589865 RepID=D6Z602_DESAT|nr:glutamine synthetase III [Desulfurivibrio alkaliphilus]ADH84884.1 glutamine synthetase catalytic region [Desulfurivibrio alkaliphilus AHT 2]
MCASSCCKKGAHHAVCCHGHGASSPARSGKTIGAAVPELFGANVFSDQVMKARLPKETYKALQRTINAGASLQADVAAVVANAMKDWAIERGATHYTHWFQPLTGATAEKHDSFISPSVEGTVIMEFSGKQLIQGEPDASSFPSGGLRVTFEARGYTAWDCTSPAFLKEDGAGNVTLCIPTAFCSYKGEALDKKTPLLRSMNAVSRQALRVLRAMGNSTSQKVIPTVGAEQEYFLVEKEYYSKRLDMMNCGRTLFGAPSPKGQELEDQYFGAIKDRVSAYMKDLDTELWKMGVTSKTKHNEVAPAQYEMAPVFTSTNIAADHNQLVMETMQKVALRHNMVCLLHEKPYAGVNGSGKHNNWSLATDDGINLLEPGQTPGDNAQFLVFLCAMIKAVDEHADIMRTTCGSSGNDHRLGANEAPPAIISIFLGQELTEILEKLAKGEKICSPEGCQFVKIGVDSLPDLPKDNTDRNRTSPFAFTGNKFEFRMVGSSQSISGHNVALNTIAAEALDEIAGRLEKAKDVNKEIQALIKETMAKHGRIIFNGNNYSDEWVVEAQKRGLPNVKNTADALKTLVTPKTIKLFDKYSVLSKEELHSRYEIYSEQYAKHLNIEARAAVQMTRRQYIPAVIRYISVLGASAGAAGKHGNVQKKLLEKISKLLEAVDKKVDKLEAEAQKARAIEDVGKQASAFRDKVIPTMLSLREDVDQLEELLPADLWPVPTYSDLLFKL